MFSIPTNVIRTGNSSLDLSQCTEGPTEWGIGRPWNHRNPETSEGADAQTCDGANQNFDHTGKGDTEPGVQLVDLPIHPIRIDQEGEVREPCEGIQGR